MDAAIQQTLLDLFTRAGDDPSTMPSIPLDSWPEQSPEQQLLAGFQQMLTRQQQYQQQLQQEHEQLTQRMQEREEQYHSIFEASTDGLFIHDMEDGHIVEVNSAGCRIGGVRSYEEIRGLSPIELIHPDDHYKLMEMQQTLLAGQNYRGRMLAVNRHVDPPVPYYVDVYASPFAYLGKPHFLAVVRDVTDQVEAYQLLERRVAERTRELSTLLHISQTVASTLELQPLLNVILDQLIAVTQCSGASIILLDDDELEIVEAKGVVGGEPVRHLRFPVQAFGPFWQKLAAHKPLIIPDVRADVPEANLFRVATGSLLATTLAYVRCWMGIPLILRDEVIGVLSITSAEPGAFSQAQAELTLTIANQAAVAIENARLYERAQAAAVLEERQRLARELHDSVSQALYGISLGAHTACTLFERGEATRLQEPLRYVLSLAETALTEMRALIFELRPETLENEGLINALSKQMQVLAVRHHLTVQTELCAEPDVSFELKQTLYRIAQEALHNIVKHAQARTVTLHLEAHDEELILTVRDDGQGFDTGGSFPGHLGLHSMRERARKPGGTLTIESAPGEGSCITACLPINGARA
jgi:PAS domain S-box-containing protein